MPQKKGYLTRHQKVTGPSTNVSDADTVDFESDSNITDVTVVDNGDTATIKIPQGGGSAVSDDGTEIVNIVQDLNFGEDLAVTDNGSGQVTIDSTAIGVNTEVYPIPLTEIYNGETLQGPRFQVSSTETIDLLQIGVQNNSEQIPTGLRIQVYDLTNDQLLVDSNSKLQTGSPLASVTGTVDLEVRIKNVTGSDQIASGFLVVGTDGGGSNVDSRTNVSDGGVEVLTDVQDINFGTNLSVVDDGDETVTITASTEGVNTELYNLPYTEVPDGDNVLGAKFNVPSGESVDLVEVGVQNDAEQAPAGLEIVVEDVTNTTELTRQASKHYSADPIATISGPVDILVKLSNSTGSAQKCSGFIVTASGPSGGGSGSTSDTRTNVSFDGSEVVSNVSDINFTSDAAINDVVVDNDNDGSVTVRVPKDEGGLDLEIDDTDAQSGIKVLDLVAGNNNVSLSHSSGDETDEAQVTITTDDTDTHTEVQKDGGSAVSDVDFINFLDTNDANVSISPNGAGVDVTVDVTDTDTHITLSESESNGISVTDPSELVMGSDLDLVDSGGGVYTVNASADAGDTHVQVLEDGQEESNDAASLDFVDTGSRVNFNLTTDANENVTIEASSTHVTMQDAGGTNDQIVDPDTVRFVSGNNNMSVELNQGTTPPEFVFSSDDTNTFDYPDIEIDGDGVVSFSEDRFHFRSGTDIDISWNTSDEIVIDYTGSGGGSAGVNLYENGSSLPNNPYESLDFSSNFSVSESAIDYANIDLSTSITTAEVVASTHIVTDDIVDDGGGTVNVNTTDSTVPDLSSSRIEATSYLESSTFQPNSGSFFDFQDSSGTSEAGRLNATSFNGNFVNASIVDASTEVQTPVLQEQSGTIDVTDSSSNSRQGALDAQNTVFAYGAYETDSNSLLYGYNISSVTLPGNGEYKVNFATSHSNGQVVPTVSADFGRTPASGSTISVHDVFSDSFQVIFVDSNGTIAIPSVFYFIVTALT
jgi:uncharacterized UPF0146 family protein